MPQVTMPQLGEGVEEGTIGKWLKGVGDHVRVGDPLVEVVTDKVNAEVPSPFEGTLTKILVAEGETIANDVAIAEVEADGAGPVDSAEGGAAVPLASTTFAPAPSAGADGAVGDPAEAPAPERSAAQPTSVSAGAAMPQAQPVAPVPIPSGIRMTPAVRRLARELRVDVTAIAGSGKGGRITREDIQRAAAGAAATGAATAPAGAAAAGTAVAGAAVEAAPTATTAGPAPAAMGAMPSSATPVPATAAPGESPVRDGDSLKRLSQMRKAIVKQMTRSLEVPTAYITFEVDMTPVVRARDAINAQYKAREGMSLSYVAYVTKACVEALRKHHDLNAHWTAEGHWRRKDINVGIAVAVEDGLVVPVIKHADNLSLHGLNAAINDLARRARTKKLTPEDLQGGTFTVDNTGWTGSILTLPIINVPEVAIITMERVVKRPVVLEHQGDAIAVRSMMNMCIAIDHRATDGAQAGEFLTDVQRWLEAVDESTPVR